MTEQERAEWEQRLAAAVAATVRRRERTRRERDQHAAARAAGLRHRHRDRLTHRKADSMTNPDDQRLTVEVSGLRDGELRDLAGSLARVAGWRTVAEPIAVVLAALARQAEQIRTRRRRTGGDPR
ncbi:hypothetical protein Vqi01_06440 [Micromonospora qiuiae]|uniref:Uncharacterized protein n=1 Tax=Micromonospora qiuiae TaxID=502268 RepID=A0ABQ4J5N2_9ACTN|nr:hypothetical protein [Micromonospora qiuiae]GIJ25482.1 hypothetical protein Vqi01_06440 [Micromonospora qiuiae]